MQISCLYTIFVYVFNNNIYTMKLQPETLLKNGSYRIISALGQGGFGITYLAEHIHMRRKVCIKEFFPTSLYRRDDISHLATVKDDDNVEVVNAFKDKFLKEARTISTMDNPHIVRVFDSFEENGTAYYVMEYIEGESLASIVERDGALDESTARRYIAEVADALGYLHERNTLHLDVKPHNIMVRKSDDRAILIDFGLAKHYDDESGTQTTSTLGGRSHGYSPIEQYDDGGVALFSPETDIYSLGATLYYLVTASHPPRANVVGSNGLPELPHSVSSPTRAAITAAMGFSIKQRPHTTATFMSHLNGGAKEPQPKRKRWWLWLLLLAIVGIVFGIALSGGEDKEEDVVVTTEAEEVVVDSLDTSETEINAASDPVSESAKAEKPAEPAIKLTSKPKASVSADSGSGKISYAVTNPSDGVKPKVKSSTDWLVVTMSGNTISYTTTANPSNKSRSAKITIIYGDESIEIVITQAGKPKPSLELTSPSSASVTADGGGGKVEYTLTNRRDDVKLSVNSSADWLIVNVSGDTITYTTKANPNESSRSAKITVTYGDQRFEIVITQAGKPKPSLELTSPSSASVTADGGGGEVEYTLTNRRDDVKLSANSSADWLIVKVSGDTITYTTKANPNDSSRSAKITVTYGDQSFEIVITQAGKPKQYNIGDYYNENGKRGVVFDVWDGGRHGKIVSLDETYVAWDSRVTWDARNGSRNGTRTYADSKSDGKANTDKIMARSDSDYFPAFKWCRAKGSSWYLPAVDELKKIYNNMSVLNATLQKYGATLNNSYYWSSTECVDNKPEFCAWHVRMREGYTYYSLKSNRYYVRAVSAF